MPIACWWLGRGPGTSDICCPSQGLAGGTFTQTSLSLPSLQPGCCAGHLCKDLLMLQDEEGTVTPVPVGAPGVPGPLGGRGRGKHVEQPRPPTAANQNEETRGCSCLSQSAPRARSTHSALQQRIRKRVQVSANQRWQR